MNVRPFDWRDIPALHRHRNDGVFLDSVLFLTRGPMMVTGVLLSTLAPTSGIFTSVLNGDDGQGPLIGQFIHSQNSQFARLSFLTPQTALESHDVTMLMDFMVVVSGERGALRMLADAEERSPSFDALRRAGFSTFSRQRIWKLENQAAVQDRPAAWRSARKEDTIAIQSLYNNLVPGLVQQVQPYVNQRPQGMVYYQQDELRAYVELKFGHRGVWVQPFIHPDAEDLVDLLLDLLHKIPQRPSRPIYICVRSYQSWLEAAIEDLGAEVGPRQAVMVRHLAVLQKAERPFSIPTLEGGQAEVSTPIVQLETERNL